MSVDHPVLFASECPEPAAGQGSYTVLPAPVQASRRVQIDVKVPSASRRSEEECRENSGNCGDRRPLRPAGRSDFHRVLVRPAGRYRHNASAYDALYVVAARLYRCTPVDRRRPHPKSPRPGCRVAQRAGDPVGDRTDERSINGTAPIAIVFVIMPRNRTEPSCSPSQTRSRALLRMAGSLAMFQKTGDRLSRRVEFHGEQSPAPFLVFGESGSLQGSIGFLADLQCPHSAVCFKALQPGCRQDGEKRGIVVGKEVRQVGFQIRSVVRSPTHLEPGRESGFGRRDRVIPGRNHRSHPTLILHRYKVWISRGRSIFYGDARASPRH